MPARHRSRSRALQVLFLWDLRKQPIGEAISAYYNTLSSEEDDPKPTEPDEFMETLAHGVCAQASEYRPPNRGEIRELAYRTYARHRPQHPASGLRDAGDWQQERRHERPSTPIPVIIDEALELARQFSGDESVSFINGVLDAVSREPL